MSLLVRIHLPCAPICLKHQRRMKNKTRLYWQSPKFCKLMGDNFIIVFFVFLLLLKFQPSSPLSCSSCCGSFVLFLVGLVPVPALVLVVDLSFLFVGVRGPFFKRRNGGLNLTCLIFWKKKHVALGQNLRYLFSNDCHPIMVCFKGFLESSTMSSTSICLSRPAYAVTQARKRLQASMSRKHLEHTQKARKAPFLSTNLQSEKKSSLIFFEQTLFKKKKKKKNFLLSYRAFQPYLPLPFPPTWLPLFFTTRAPAS